MKKILLISIFFVLLVLSGCDSNQEAVKKKDFYIQTRPLSGFTNQIVVEKSATLNSDQNIMVTAQANGRAGEILVKDGDAVTEGQVVVKLKDDVANYWLAVQRAKTALDSARIQYKNAKIALGKWISDSQLNMERSKNTLLSVQDASKEAIKNAKQNLNSAGTKLNILKQQFNGEKTKILNVYQSVIDFSDKILWVTTNNEHLSQNFQYLLSAKNPSLKTQAKDNLRRLMNLQRDLQNIQTENLSNQELLAQLKTIQGAYNQVDVFLLQMIDVMYASVDGAKFPKVKIDGIIGNINTHKGMNQKSLAAFNAYKAQVEWVLADSSNPGKNTLEESAKIWYETTKIKTQKNIFDANIAVKNAEKTYTTAIETQTTQLQLLATNIRQAEIAYQDAQTLYWKLTIKSPISGVVGNIMIDKGQEIRMGTPIFSISNETEQLIDIYVSTNEYKYLKIDDKAQITYNNQTYTGFVHSIANIASRNGLYKVKIAVKGDVKLLWGVADIVIPVKVNGLRLPLNMVTIIGENKGYVWWYDNNVAIKHIVDLWEVWGDSVKILSALTGEVLITSDIENFDDNLYQLVVKN